MADTNLTTLRLWLKDSGKTLFSDAELTSILTRNGAIVDGADVTLTNKMLDLSRADAYELLTGDPAKFNSYSIGGVSETISKELLLQMARDLRKRYIIAIEDID